MALPKITISQKQKNTNEKSVTLIEAKESLGLQTTFEGVDPGHQNESPWLYQGKPLLESDLESYISFVYVITHIESGKRYVGKKLLTKKTTRKPLKGKKRKRITYSDSDWRDYWGSNESLQEEVKKQGPEKFKREILRLCKTRSEASYFETKYQFAWDVLLHPDLFWNEWIMCKIRSAHLRNLR